MAVFTGAGTTLALTATAPYADVLEAYEALAFTEVGEVSDLGEVPTRIYGVAAWRPIGKRGESKAKDGFTYAPQTITVGVDPEDPGQSMLDAAILSDAAYSLRIANEAIGTIYGRVLVLGGPMSFGDVNTIVTRQVTLEYLDMVMTGPFPDGALILPSGDFLTLPSGAYLGVR